MRILSESVDKRLSGVLDAAIEIAALGEKRVSSIDIARHVFQSEAALMDQLKELWMVEKLAWYVNRKRGELWRAKRGPQMYLPGFEDVPKTIFLRNGQRPRLEYATVGAVEDHVKLLRSRFRDSRKVKKMEAVLELMRKYTPDEKDITWGEVKKKELERRDFDRLVGL
jgi:hypothetical protein